MKNEEEEYVKGRKKTVEAPSTGARLQHNNSG